MISKVLPFARLFSRVEWPTFALIVACYAVWLTLAIAGSGLNPLIWILLTGVMTTLYWSLVHEIVHGHPTRNPAFNQALVALPIGWVFPIARFRDGHLQHHMTGALTDPFDDPESWYMEPARWRRTPAPLRAVLIFNNTLFGRMLIGPLVTIWRMAEEDAKLILRGGESGRAVASAWGVHAISVTVLAALLWAVSPVPVWQFAAAAYLGMSILLIRTFIEHQAAEDVGERTVIIEDSGPLAFLFLFNNLHVVHHTRPGLPWYRLPGFYRAYRGQFIRRNKGYVYPGYGAVFRRYFFRAKEVVPHPHMG